MTRRKFSRECKIEAVRLVTDRRVAVAQAARDLGADRFPFGEIVVEMRVRHAKKARDLCFRRVCRRDHILTRQFARMRWTAV